MNLKTLTGIGIIAIFFSYTPAQRIQETILFRDIDVFDGTRMIRHTNVLIQDGMIRAVGSAKIAGVESAKIINGKGNTLLPGFIDAHTHLGQNRVEELLKDALRFGVTTELEMFGSAASLALRKKMAFNEDPTLADFRTAGIGITASGGHPTQMAGKPTPFATLSPSEDSQVFVDARITEGSDYIKIIDEHLLPTLSKHQIQNIVTAAHSRNKLVVVHINTQSEARDVITAGVDGLAHSFSDTLPASDFASFAAQYRVFVIPTLVVFEAISLSAPAKSVWWQHTPAFAAHLSPSMQSALMFTFPPHFQKPQALVNAKAAVRQLHDADVPILAGTDAPVPGIVHGASIHRELELLVQSGLTPLEALAAATSGAAQIFGFRDRGRIAQSLRADLLLVDGDPSVDITATRNIVGVWKLGVRTTRYSSTIHER